MSTMNVLYKLKDQNITNYIVTGCMGCLNPVILLAFQLLTVLLKRK